VTSTALAYEARIGTREGPHGRCGLCHGQTLTFASNLAERVGYGGSAMQVQHQDPRSSRRSRAARAACALRCACNKPASHVNCTSLPPGMLSVRATRVPRNAGHAEAAAMASSIPSCRKVNVAHQAIAVHLHWMDLEPVSCNRASTSCTGADATRPPRTRMLQ
jgi:hypothetical protein